MKDRGWDTDMDMDKDRVRAVVDQEIPAMSDKLKRRIRFDLEQAMQAEILMAESLRAETAKARPFKVVRKVWLLAAALLVLTIGTALALSARSGFAPFYGEQDVEILLRSSQPVYVEDRQGDVSLVLEEIVNADGRFLISVSLLNLGEEPWSGAGQYSKPRLEVKDRANGMFEDIFGSDGILSEEGRKLTFLYEGFTESDLDGSELLITMENLERVDAVEREVEIPLDQLFSQGIAVTTYGREDVGVVNNSDVEELYHRIPKRAPLILHEDISHSIVTAAALVEKGVFRHMEEELDGGMVFFFEFPGREKMVDWVGLNIRDRASKSLSPDVLHMIPTEGVYHPAAVVYFMPGIIESDLEDWVIQKIWADERVIVEEGSWEIAYKVESGKVGFVKKFTGAAEHKYGGRFIGYDGEVVVSPLGVTLRGRAWDDPKEITANWYDFQVELWDDQGYEMPLRQRMYSGFDDDWNFAIEFVLNPDSNPQQVLELEKVGGVTINGVRLNLRDEWDEGDD